MALVLSPTPIIVESHGYLACEATMVCDLKAMPHGLTIQTRVQPGCSACRPEM